MLSQKFSLAIYVQMKNFQLTNSEDRRAYNSEGRRDDNSKGNFLEDKLLEPIFPGLTLIGNM